MKSEQEIRSKIETLEEIREEYDNDKAKWMASVLRWAIDTTAVEE